MISVPLSAPLSAPSSDDVAYRGPADAGEGLATARLELRRFERNDLALLDRLNSDAEVMRYLGGAVSLDATRAMLENRILRYYDEHPGLGVWATLLRDSGDCIGFHLLNHVQGETIIQVGYRLFPAYWGQGYATEMSFALLHYGFVQKQLAQLTANAHLDNLASQRVLLKCGLARNGVRTFAHPAYAAYANVAYFERTAADWLADYSNIQQTISAEHGVGIR